VSRYCTRSDIERVFGAENLSRWASIESDVDPDVTDSRIAHAIDIAEAEVDSILAGSPLRVPVATTPDGTPTLIREAAATLAGVYLYESRGAQAIAAESGTPSHPYIFKRIWALGVLQDLREGKRRIPGVV